MKSMYRKPAIFVISKLSTLRQFSSLTTTHQFHGSRRFEEESRSVRVSVLWDIENCEVPSNANVLKVVQSITNAPSINGIKGPMHITAFGDVTRIPRANLELLSAVGVHVTHFPSGGQSRLMKLMHWALENPPPQHLFLISGDEVYADILHQLRRSNYNILLSGPENAPSILCSAATMMWHWSSLLKGDNLSGKLFNHPPDGPNGSLYGHFRAPLEDPFPVAEQSLPFPANGTSSIGDKVSSELVSESRYRPIPKSVSRLISQILSSYPEGMTITQLRAELAKCDLLIDRDFYGYKKFSRFLLAMPLSLKLHSGEDGRFMVQGIKPKFPEESAVLDKEPKTSIELSDPSVSGLRPNGRMSSTEEVSNQPMMMPTVSELQLQSKLGNKIELQKEGKPNGSYTPMHTHESKMRANVKDVEKEMQKKSSRKRGFNEMHNVDETTKLVQQPEKVVTSSPVAEVASSADEIKDSSDKLENRSPVDSDNSPSPKYGIFRKLWRKLFGGGEDHSKPDSKLMTEDNQKAKNQEKADELSISSKNLNIFSKDAFWEEVGYFIDTAQGLALFSQSKTREHLAHNLQEHGPEILRSLPVDDLRHLVDLLISDRKWIEELESQMFPFKVIRSPERNISDTNATSSLNGLSHIFTGKQANAGESDKKKPQNPPFRRASSIKPKGEILADCQKLLDEIVDNHPSGYNMGLFRRHFMEKYGYALSVQKLGYEKLVNLLQDMPGIRIESALILPVAALKGLDQNQNPVDLSIQESKTDKVAPNSDSESSEVSVKDDEGDSAWDELGPVDDLLTKKIEKGYGLSSQNGKRRSRVPEYEPPVENDFSDSDEETLKLSPNEVKSKSGDEDSSLIQILDQWYGEVEDKQAKGNDVNEAETFNDASAATGNGSKSDVKYPKKQRYGKSYKFVSEEATGNSEDNFVHGVLSTLKNSGGKSAESKAEGESLSASH